MSGGVMVLPGPLLVNGVMFLLWNAQRQAAASAVGDLGKAPSAGAAGEPSLTTELFWVCPVCGHRNAEDMTEPATPDSPVTPCCGVSMGRDGVVPMWVSS